MSLAFKINLQKAFTLIEVMVALAVLAIGMMTLVKVSSQHVIQTAYLKDKTLAQWVATNKVNEVKLLGGWPKTGTSKGSEMMAQQEWLWKLKISNTPDKDIRRLDVDVRKYNVEGEPVVRFISFIGR